MTIDWWVYFATFMEEEIVLNKVWWVQKLGKSESWWVKVSQLGEWLMNNTAIRRVLRPAPEIHDLLKEFMFLLLDFFKPKSGGCSLPVWVIYLPRSLPPVCLLCGLPPRWKSPSLQQRQHLVPGWLSSPLPNIRERVVCWGWRSFLVVGSKGMM